MMAEPHETDRYAALLAEQWPEVEKLARDLDRRTRHVERATWISRVGRSGDR